MKRKPDSIFTTTDPSVIVSRFVSLKDIRVLAYHRDGSCQEIVIEQVLECVSCPGFGNRARV